MNSATPAAATLIGATPRRPAHSVIMPTAMAPKISAAMPRYSR